MARSIMICDFCLAVGRKFRVDMTVCSYSSFIWNGPSGPSYNGSPSQHILSVVKYQCLSRCHCPDRLYQSGIPVRSSPIRLTRAVYRTSVIVTNLCRELRSLPECLATAIKFRRSARTVVVNRSSLRLQQPLHWFPGGSPVQIPDVPVR